MAIWERNAIRQDETNPQNLKYVLKLAESHSATREQTARSLVALICFIAGYTTPE